jgi:hypothetical protein
MKPRRSAYSLAAALLSPQGCPLSEMQRLLLPPWNLPLSPEFIVEARLL